MKASTKRWLNFGFLFLTLALVLFIGFRGNEPAEVLKELKSLSPGWGMVFIACWFFYMVFETISINAFIKQQNYKVSLWHIFKVVLIGNYYSNITPSSTGGQPMQVYYLKKYGVPIGVGTSILAVRFFVYQLALLTMSTFLWVTNAGFIQQQLKGKIALIIIGYLFNFASVIGILLLAINKKLIAWLLNLIINLISKIKFIKNKSKLINKINNQVSTFNDSVSMIKKHPGELFIQYLITILQLTSIFAIPIFLYKAFNLSGTSNSELLAISTLLYVAASYTPLPGASGAQEGGFAIFFDNIFPGATLFSALLLWRFFSYYLTLLFGIAITIRSMFTKKDKDNKS
ncbi:MAG: flippase-like domain-containing protein [Christensenellaceae bacterium]|nr:flippase-like domain-containing protein [Christensenellaceae bacterium]